MKAPFRVLAAGGVLNPWQQGHASRRGSWTSRTAGQVGPAALRRGAGRAQVHTDNAGRGRQLGPALSRVAPGFPTGGACPPASGLLPLPRWVTSFG